jgi:uncharacterized protein YigE (DUF2233 family)
MKNASFKCLICLGILALLSSLSAEPQEVDWNALEPGLLLKLFEAPQKSHIGDSQITVLKIDPNAFSVDIYCASEFGDRLRSISEWGREFDLAAAVNAGMYGRDLRTSVGYLKSGNHLNNGRLNRSYNSIFSCGPLRENIPPVQIIDRRYQDFSEWKDKYRSFSQSIRMISCQQQNVWEQQPKKWSIAALAVDKSGSLLFIHCRSPYSVHDFIDMLLELPLDIYNAMYLEGGPEASLYYSAGGIEKELIGSYETGFFMNDSNRVSWKIPNVIGVSREKRKFR